MYTLNLCTTMAVQHSNCFGYSLLGLPVVVYYLSITSANFRVHISSNVSTTQQYILLFSLQIEYSVLTAITVPCFVQNFTFSKNCAMTTLTLLMVPELVRAFMMVIRWCSNWVDGTVVGCFLGTPVQMKVMQM